MECPRLTADRRGDCPSRRRPATLHRCLVLSSRGRKARLPFCRHCRPCWVAAADGRCQAMCCVRHTRLRCGIAAAASGDPPQQGAVGGPRRWRCRANASAVRVSPPRFSPSPPPPVPVSPTQTAGPDWSGPTCGQALVPPAGSVRPTQIRLGRGSNTYQRNPDSGARCGAGAVALWLHSNGFSPAASPPRWAQG